MSVIVSLRWQQILLMSREGEGGLHVALEEMLRERLEMCGRRIGFPR